MALAGVPSSEYKFKVLSLDARGQKYLIMVDLASHQAQQVARLTEIERHIVQSTKTQHDIEVTSIYWRVDEHITSEVVPAPKVDVTPTPPRVVPTLQVAQQSNSRQEAPLLDELQAFKRASSVLRKQDASTNVADVEDEDEVAPPNFADTEFLEETGSTELEKAPAMANFANTEFLDEAPEAKHYARQLDAGPAANFAHTEFLADSSIRSAALRVKNGVSERKA